MIMDGAEEAQLALETAVRDFMHAVEPEAMPEEFFISISYSNMEDSSFDGIKYAESPGLTWISRRGMLEIAVEHYRNIGMNSFLAYSEDTDEDDD